MAVTGRERLEDSGYTQVVCLVQVDDPFGGYIIRAYGTEVIVGEDASQRTALGIVSKTHFPDSFGRSIVRPHVFVVTDTGGNRLRTARQEVVTAVDDLGGILDSFVPFLHIKGNSGT